MYQNNADAVVFVLDGNVKTNHPEIQKELKLLFANKKLQNAVFLLLVNKGDLEGCIEVEEVVQLFELA